MPRLGDDRRGQRLTEIAGTVPPLTDLVIGCKFAGRCPHAFDLCRQEQPLLKNISAGRLARCWLFEFPEQRSHHG